MFNLESSIQSWLKSFRKHRAYNEASFYEMELHLRDHIEDLANQGFSKEDAFKLAVQEFGDIPTVAKEEYWNQQRKRTFTRMLYSTLFKNYCKTSLRSMMRNPLSSFINIIGLAICMSVGLLVIAFMFELAGFLLLIALLGAVKIGAHASKSDS